MRTSTFGCAGTGAFAARYKDALIQLHAAVLILLSSSARTPLKTTKRRCQNKNKIFIYTSSYS